MIYLSICMVIFGFLIRTLSYIELKNNFSWRVKYPDSLCTNGIYKFIRHPMYLGGIIGYFGLFLYASNNLILSIVFIAFVISFCLDRIDREDQLLYNKFDNEFEEYFNKTSALIPRLI